MSICSDGLDAKLHATSIITLVSPSESLVNLANALEWAKLADIVLADLKKTAKGMWHVGRKLSLRTHLAVMILQGLLKETDRGIEERIHQTPVLQVFSGQSIVPRWRCPDHTKIEEFRNRLSPDTHRALAQYVVQVAHRLGFADPSWMDIDSTVQQANIAYPADGALMKKMAEKCHYVVEYLKRKKKAYAADLQVNIDQIRKKARAYFFLAKNAAIDKRRALFKTYHHVVKGQLRPILERCAALTEQQLRRLPWNIRKSIEQLRHHGRRYLLDVAHFIRTHTIKAGKLLSLHAQAVACIKKGKAGKEFEFGRVFQLGRVGGNFLIPFACIDVRMPDKRSILPAVHEHQQIFGSTTLKQLGADKGYYSMRNIRDIEDLAINADGVQRPANVLQQLSPDVIQPLKARRAGIEPLIQHAKEFGLGRSRMKSDAATLASGYRSVTSFNLHQLVRHMVRASAA